MDNLKKTELFEELLAHGLSALRFTALRIVGNTDDADDAVQSALLHAWEKFSSFRHGSKLSSWVTRIVINESYNLLRNNDRNRVDLSPDELETMREAPAPSAANRTEEAMRNLPRRHRDILEIAVLSNLTGKEAAELAGCSENTLYQRVRRAKQALKSQLEAMQYEEE